MMGVNNKKCGLRLNCISYSLLLDYYPEFSRDRPAYATDSVGYNRIGSCALIGTLYPDKLIMSVVQIIAVFLLQLAAKPVNVLFLRCWGWVEVMDH